MFQHTVMRMVGALQGCMFAWLPTRHNGHHVASAAHSLLYSRTCSGKRFSLPAQVQDFILKITERCVPVMPHEGGTETHASNPCSKH